MTDGNGSEHRFMNKRGSDNNQLDGWETIVKVMKSRVNGTNPLANQETQEGV